MFCNNLKTNVDEYHAPLQPHAMAALVRNVWKENGMYNRSGIWGKAIQILDETKNDELKQQHLLLIAALAKIFPDRMPPAVIMQKLMRKARNDNESIVEDN